jgi:hypothetical protein
MLNREELEAGVFAIPSGRRYIFVSATRKSARFALAELVHKPRELE